MKRLEAREEQGRGGSKKVNSTSGEGYGMGEEEGFRTKFGETGVDAGIIGSSWAVSKFLVFLWKVGGAGKRDLRKKKG